MAFPSSPVNGQTYQRFGRTYEFNSATGSWNVLLALSATSLATLSADIIPTPGSSIDIGSSAYPVEDLFLKSDSTINIGGSAFTAESFLNFDLNVLPEVLEIQVDAPAAGNGQDWL